MQQSSPGQPLSPCFFFVLTLATSLPPPPLPASAGGAAAHTHIIKPRQAELGWKCSRVPAGGCERRVPAGERSDPAGSSSAQPGLAEAERRAGLAARERAEDGGMAGQERLAVDEGCHCSGAGGGESSPGARDLVFCI